MKKLCLIFVVLAAPLAAQSIPSQFAGLITGSSFTATISGTVMTVTGSPAWGTIQVGQEVTGAGITGQPAIVSLGTGTGGAGTYNIATSQTVSSPTTLYGDTDETLNPSWTTPSTPSPGGSYVDSIFGITVNRISAATSDCPVNGTYNPTGDCSVTNHQMQVDYSNAVPWSVNENYYVVDSNGFLLLYSRSTGGVYTYIRTLRTFCGAISGTCTSNYGSTRDNGSGDTSFSGALWGDSSGWNWANNASSNPDFLYYTGSTAASPNVTQLKAYNADADSISVIHDFTTEIATVNGWGDCTHTANSITLTRQGNQSNDDRYWAYVVMGGNQAETQACAVGVYDKTANATIALVTLGANGMCGVPSCASLNPDPYPHGLGMSMSGTYMIVKWKDSAYAETWTNRGVGAEEFTNTLSYVGVVSGNNGHADTGFDAAGNEVYVVNSSSEFAYGRSAMEICKLSAVNTSAGTSGGCRRYINLPCTWIATTCPYSGENGNTWFLSMRGTAGTPGWPLLSTQTGSGTNWNSSQGDGGWGALELDAFYVNWNTAQVGLSGVPPETLTVRLGRNHAALNYDSANNDYGSQVNAAPDRNFTKFAWFSNMDANPTAQCAGQTPSPGSAACNYYSMYTELGSSISSSPATVFIGAGALTLQ